MFRGGDYVDNPAFNSKQVRNKMDISVGAKIYKNRTSMAPSPACPT